jgi:hypothetical protein
LFSISGVLVPFLNLSYWMTLLNRVSSSNTRFSMFFVSLGCVTLIDVIGSSSITRRNARLPLCSVFGIPIF